MLVDLILSGADIFREEDKRVVGCGTTYGSGTPYDRLHLKLDMEGFGSGYGSGGGSGTAKGSGTKPLCHPLPGYEELVEDQNNFNAFWRHHANR